MQVLSTMTNFSLFPALKHNQVRRDTRTGGAFALTRHEACVAPQSCLYGNSNVHRHL
jgi:hypothetical protein